MDNPYASPLGDPAMSDELRRPVGVAILSVLTGIVGLALLGGFVVLVVNWQENNEFASIGDSHPRCSGYSSACRL